MDYCSLHLFSRRSLKGHYAASLRASWTTAGLLLLCRLVPAGLAALLLVRGTDYQKNSLLWGSFLLLWELFSFGMLLPVRCAVWSRFGAWLGLCRMRTCFSRLRGYLRAVRIVGTADLLRALAWLPPTASALLTVVCLRESVQGLSAEIRLFWAAQGIALCFWTSFFAVRLQVGLCAVPLLCTQFPQEGTAAVLRRSLRLLRGHHREYWSILLCYAPAAVIFLPMPFLLPWMFADMTLFLQLRIREEEQCPT